MAEPSLSEVLRRSAASHEFKAAVRALEAGDFNHARCRIETRPGEPPNKVLYAILQVLDSEPGREVDSVRVEGQSEATSYSGEITLQPGNVRYRFVWDCRWKAQQMGWVTSAGQPNSSRAQREFGHQCFRVFERVP